MSAITSTKYERAKRIRDSILQEYNLETLKEKRLEYIRTRAPSLRNVDALYRKYIRNCKVIQNYEIQNPQIPMWQCCDNCHREDHDYNTNNDIYKLHLIQQNKDNIKGNFF